MKPGWQLQQVASQGGALAWLPRAPRPLVSRVPLSGAWRGFSLPTRRPAGVHYGPRAWSFGVLVDSPAFPACRLPPSAPLHDGLPWSSERVSEDRRRAPSFLFVRLWFWLPPIPFFVIM